MNPWTQIQIVHRDESPQTVPPQIGNVRDTSCLLSFWHSSGVPCLQGSQSIFTGVSLIFLLSLSLGCALLTFQGSKVSYPRIIAKITSNGFFVNFKKPKNNPCNKGGP